MVGPGESKPILYYFNVKARAYPIKMLFMVGNVEFEDVKVSKDDFPKQKGNMPMGQLPVLEYSNKKMCQTQAIAEFAAEKGGMTPKDSWERCKVTEIIGCCQDVSQKCMVGVDENNSAKKKQMREELCKVALPEMFGCLDRIIHTNGHPGFCVGSKMTAADAYVCCMVDQLKCGQCEYVPSDIVDKHVNIMKVYEMMMKNPKVKECKTCEDKANSIQF